jgi:hypothetical protein
MKMKILPFRDVYSLKYLVLGFFIAFAVHSANSCKKVDTESESNNPDSGFVDTGKMDDAVKTVSTAFISGDANKVRSILTETALAKYGDGLSKVNKSSLIKFGEALKNSELKVGTELYAEYIFTKDGTQFSIAMARQADGSWKLMRF